MFRSNQDIVLNTKTTITVIYGRRVDVILQLSW